MGMKKNIQPIIEFTKNVTSLSTTKIKH